jgi:hypothetical protein
LFQFTERGGPRFNEYAASQQSTRNAYAILSFSQLETESSVPEPQLIARDRLPLDALLRPAPSGPSLVRR